MTGPTGGNRILGTLSTADGKGVVRMRWAALEPVYQELAADADR